MDICGYLQLDLCVLTHYCFNAYEVLFKTLQFTRLFAVTVMCCAWKFHGFQFKCVCSFYCFYAEVTIYDSCNTKKSITVKTIVEGLTNKILGQWKGLQMRLSDIPNPRKEEDSRNRMGGSVWSTIQKVESIHQL